MCEDFCGEDLFGCDPHYEMLSCFLAMLSSIE